MGKAVGGVGPVVAREAVWRAFGGETPLLACDLDEAQKQALCAAIENLKDEHAAGGTPTAVRIPQPDGVNKPVEFSFFIPQQYGSAAILTQYPTYSELLEDYYATKDRAERLKQKSRELYKAVHNLYERAVRKQSARREELAQSEKADTLRLYGELLQANQWAIQKGDRQATVQNYYTGEDVTIRLDPRLGPNENAQKYFDKYGKMKRTAEALNELILETKGQIDHLESIQNSLDIALSADDLVQIKDELIEYGFIKKGKGSKKQKVKSKPFHYISSDGFDMYVGKNNYQNDELTFKLATGNDWWFHAKGMPGSHVIVKAENKELPDSTFEEAGKLAGYYSKGKNADKVEIDYLQKKNVKKPNGAAAGFVVYYTNYSLTIHPDISDIRQIE